MPERLDVVVVDASLSSVMVPAVGVVRTGALLTAETVMALPLRSAMSVLLSAPGAQSSAAAMLYVVPCVEVVPLLATDQAERMDFATRMAPHLS